MNNIENINKIDWQKVDGLVPVITQDANNLEVLMFAFMNKEALELSLKTGFAHYFSRTKKRIWKKGESSNHTQEIIDIFVDCDSDTILLKVIQQGVACHTGRKTCFFTDLKTDEIKEKIEIDTSVNYGVIDTLYNTILSRRFDDPSKSYTAKLLSGEQNSMLKKIVEEAGEFTFAIKDKDEKIGRAHV